MSHYLLEVDTATRSCEIVFESDSDESAVADLMVFAHKRRTNDLARVSLYRLSIGSLDRETGVFSTVVGDVVYDSDDAGESEVEDAVELVEATT